MIKGHILKDMGCLMNTDINNNLKSTDDCCKLFRKELLHNFISFIEWKIIHFTLENH